MTTEPSTSAPTQRRFTALDGIVFTVALIALGLPFAARWMENAHASGPQIAVKAEISSIRPIDYALGYTEQKAEDAFFEGLEQPAPFVDPTEAALDRALAAPVPGQEDTYIAAPQAQVIDLTATEPQEVDELSFGAPQVEDGLQTARLEAPELTRDVAPLLESLPEDDEITAEIAEPTAPDDITVAEVIEEPEPQPLMRVIMSAPPTMTPVPLTRPAGRDTENVSVASLDLRGLQDGTLQIPIDVTPPLPSAPSRVKIEEAPLPPPSAQRPAPTVVAMAQPEQTAPVMNDAAPAVPTRALEALPADVTPDRTKEAPRVVQLPKSETPAEQPKITNGPRIALVIAAAGLNTNVTRFAIEALPEGVTLAFAPVKAEARTLAQEAKQDGHTVLVEIPMEPINKTRDPGPLTLRVADPASQNLDRLDEALARIPNADGVSSYLGARFTSVESASLPILAELSKRGLFMFENEPTARSVLQQVALRSELPYARGKLKIDRDRNGAAIRASLDALEKEARLRGSAIGVGTTLRGTISTVALWAKEAEKRGVRFVPITEIAR